MIHGPLRGPLVLVSAPQETVARSFLARKSIPRRLVAEEVYTAAFFAEEVHTVALRVELRIVYQ